MPSDSISIQTILSHSENQAIGVVDGSWSSYRGTCCCPRLRSAFEDNICGYGDSESVGAWRRQEKKKTFYSHRQFCETRFCISTCLRHVVFYGTSDSLSRDLNFFSFLCVDNWLFQV